jgi:hypothetical protein
MVSSLELLPSQSCFLEANKGSNGSVNFSMGILTEREGSVQLTSLYQLVKISSFANANVFYNITKQATLMRRSNTLSLPLIKDSLKIALNTLTAEYGQFLGAVALPIVPSHLPNANKLP